MALTSWKQFPFFSVSQVPIAADEDGDYIFSNDIRCLTTGSESLYLGTEQGTVRILSKAFRVLRSFQASDTPGAAVSHVRQIPGTTYLATISEDLTSEATLRLWSLDKTDKKTGSPQRLSETRVQNGRRLFPV